MNSLNGIGTKILNNFMPMAQTFQQVGAHEGGAINRDLST